VSTKFLKTKSAPTKQTINTPWTERAIVVA
jgi:hypothetical protein